MLASNLYRPERTGAGSNVFRTVKAMDIELVVLEKAGHWLGDAKFSHMCSAYIPIDMTRDAGLSDRIVAALKGSGRAIHGVFTFLESYSPHLARAADVLGLPTAPSQGLEIAIDKYKTSVSAGHRSYNGDGVAGAQQVIDDSSIEYPLIVKPCRGWSSEGVAKVDNQTELIQAIEAIQHDSLRHGTRYVVEEYCSGPEVDANLILCDGRLVFFETSDDFPKTGDADGEIKGGSSFIELANVFPSALPPSELNMLSTSLHENLKKLGFEAGLFHLEARIKNSEMEYQSRDGVLDLYYVSGSSNYKEASSWLIEINPRPPGIQETDAVERTYGIDYVGVALAFSLNDRELALAMSQPFFHGAQYWCEIIFVPVDRGGVFASENICEELMARRPDLTPYISKSYCFFDKGDLVPAPSSGTNAWVAYFIAFSRVGRKHLIEVSETIRKELRWFITG